MNRRRLARTRLKIDQTTDGPNKVKQVTAGPDKVKQEAFGPEKVEQAAAGHGRTRLNRRRPANHIHRLVCGSYGPLPIV